MFFRRLRYVLGALNFAELISAGAIPIAKENIGRMATISKRSDGPWPKAVVGD